MPQNPLELQHMPNTEPEHVKPSGVPPLGAVPQWPLGETGCVGVGEIVLEVDEEEDTTGCVNVDEEMFDVEATVGCVDDDEDVLDVGEVSSEEAV